MTCRYRINGEAAFPFSPPWPQPATTGLQLPREKAMAGKASNFRAGLARARRDLCADWRRWSLAERLSALTGGAALALLPVLAWSGLVIP
jgi:hypothetical protein